MKSVSRRQTLGFISGAFCMTAGCTTTSGSVPTDTPTMTESNLTYSNCVANPDTIQIRNPEGNRPIRSTTHEYSDEDFRIDVWYVSNPNQRDALEYASNVDGIEGVIEFLENTDLSRHTVVVIQFNFDSCETIDVEFVKWQEVENGKRTGHKVAIRAPLSIPDGECPRDSTEYIEATVLRIPADVNEILSSSVGGAVDPAANC